MKRYPTIIYFSCVNRKCIGKKVGGKNRFFGKPGEISIVSFLPRLLNSKSRSRSKEEETAFLTRPRFPRMEYRFKARNPLIFSSARTVEDYYPVFAEPFAKILPHRSSIPFHECMNVFSPFFLFLFLYN